MAKECGESSFLHFIPAIQEKWDTKKVIKCVGNITFSFLHLHKTVVNSADTQIQ